MRDTSYIYIPIRHEARPYSRFKLLTALLRSIRMWPRRISSTRSLSFRVSVIPMCVGAISLFDSANRRIVFGSFSFPIAAAHMNLTPLFRSIQLVMFLGACTIGVPLIILNEYMSGGNLEVCLSSLALSEGLFTRMPSVPLSLSRPSTCISPSPPFPHPKAQPALVSLPPLPLKQIGRVRRITSSESGRTEAGSHGSPRLSWSCSGASSWHGAPGDCPPLSCDGGTPPCGLLLSAVAVAVAAHSSVRLAV